MKALAGLTIAAVLVAGWFGLSWISAAQDSELRYARERDAAYQAAATGLVVLHTIDYRTAERDLDRWNDVTAGELRSDLRGDRDGQLKRASGGQTVSTAKLVRAAVTELDDHAGKARVIAVVDVRLATKDRKASTDRRRMNAELARGPRGWKITTVEAAS